MAPCTLDENLTCRVILLPGRSAPLGVADHPVEDAVEGHDRVGVHEELAAGPWLPRGVAGGHVDLDARWQIL